MVIIARRPRGRIILGEIHVVSVCAQMVKIQIVVPLVESDVDRIAVIAFRLFGRNKIVTNAASIVIAADNARSFHIVAGLCRNRESARINGIAKRGRCSGQRLRTVQHAIGIRNILSGCNALDSVIRIDSTAL